MTVWRPFIRVYMWHACIFWTCNCYKTRIEWKINSLIRRKKSCDILRYEFRIAIRYKFYVYCDISIYCDTPSKRTLRFLLCTKNNGNDCNHIVQVSASKTSFQMDVLVRCWEKSKNRTIVDERWQTRGADHWTSWSTDSTDYRWADEQSCILVWLEGELDRIHGCQWYRQGHCGR